MSFDLFLKLCYHRRLPSFQPVAHRNDKAVYRDTERASDVALTWAVRGSSAIGEVRSMAWLAAGLLAVAGVVRPLEAKLW